MKVELWKNANLYKTMELDDSSPVHAIVVQDTREPPVAEVFVRTQRNKFFHIDSKWVSREDLEDPS